MRLSEWRPEVAIHLRRETPVKLRHYSVLRDPNIAVTPTDGKIRHFTGPPFSRWLFFVFNGERSTHLQGATDSAVMLFLIAEDEPAMRFVVKALISEAFPEAQVLGFENGLLALAAFEQVGANLVVCDHFMPVMNGTVLVRNLRRLRPTLPILMVSGSPEARTLGAAVGISAFVHKHRLAGELIDQIKLLLATSADHRDFPPRHASAA